MVKQSNAWPVYKKYRIDWQLIIEEHVPVGSRGDLKAETESKIIAHEAFTNGISCNKNTWNSNMANADYVNNMTRQLTTLYQHAQYWQKNNTYNNPGFPTCNREFLFSNFSGWWVRVVLFRWCFVRVGL